MRVELRGMQRNTQRSKNAYKLFHIPNQRQTEMSPPESLLNCMLFPTCNQFPCHESMVLMTTHFILLPRFLHASSLFSYLIPSPIPSPFLIIHLSHCDILSNTSSVMAKLVPAVALISVLLVLMANVSSAYRTTITTVEIDDSSRRGQSCRQEAQTRDLSACERFIRRSGRSSEDYLALKGAENPQEQTMRQCCNQLDKVREDCQCEALKYAVEQQMQQGREESQRMRQRASQIPSSCGISQCEMRLSFF